MAKCPYCAEDILAGAVKCKHCGEWLSQPLANSAGTTPAPLPVSSRQTPEKSRLVPYLFLAFAVLYTLSPVDLIPDVPVVGWFDDFLALAAAGLNVLQLELGMQNRILGQILAIVKWGVIALASVLVLLVGLLGVVIIKLFSS